MIHAVLIELTNKCNAYCKYCYNREQKKFSWDLEELKEVCSKLLIYGIKTFIISGGEPFVYSNISDFIRWAARKDIQLIFATNGIFLPPHIISLLKETSSSVQVTLDTIDRDAFYLLKCVDKLNDVINTILALKSAHIPCTIAITLNKITLDSFEKTIEFCVKNQFERIHVGEVKLVGRAEKFIRELDCGEIPIYSKLYSLQKEYYPKISIDLIEDIIIGYLGLRDHEYPYYCNSFCGKLLQIDHLGNTYICENIPDRLSLGNIVNEPIEQILQKQQKIMKSLECFPCRECEFFTLCRGGCRALTYQATGSMQKAHPRCNEIKTFIKQIYKDDRLGVIDNILFETELRYHRGSMHGLCKWV